MFGVDQEVVVDDAVVALDVAGLDVLLMSRVRGRVIEPEADLLDELAPERVEW